MLAPNRFNPPTLSRSTGIASITVPRRDTGGWQTRRLAKLAAGEEDESRVAGDSSSSSSSSGRYRVRVKQPLGIVLAEDAAKSMIIVEEIVPGGNADKTGSLAVGDVLTGCSAVTLKEAKLSGSFEKEGYGARPYDNWQEIWVDTRGLKFDTVMSALSSNNPRWGIFTIELELERQRS